MRRIGFDVAMWSFALALVGSILMLPAVTAASPIGPDTELLTNGGFESGAEGMGTVGWTVVGQYGANQTAGRPRSGNWYGLVYSAGSSMTQTQTFADGFAPNVKSLLFDGWTKNEINGSGTGYYLVDVYAGNMTGDTFTSLEHLSLTGSELADYHQLRGTLAVHHGTGTDVTNCIKVILQTDPVNDPVGVAAWFDDLSLKTTSTPEPSTIVLLVSGVCALLTYAWRKRK
jgi:hypothetical protein